MKEILLNLKYLFLLWILLGVAVFVTYGHHGHLIMDCGREVYYPVQILDGKVLYKDLFNIYGPFSYMFNAFLFKLFSINLNTLYLAGCFSAVLIVTLIYKIAGKFLPEFLSFSIAFLTICTGVLNTNLFNLIFPYSYAMLYGTVAFLASFLFLTRYVQNPEKTLNLYFSGLLAGLAVANKYDFLPYLFIFLFVAIKTDKISFKRSLLLLCSILFVPVVCFSILFLQGLSSGDFISVLITLKSFAKSETLRYFYKTQGVYFHRYIPELFIYSILKIIIPLGLILIGFKLKQKVLFIIFILSGLYFGHKFINSVSLSFIPFLIFVLTVINFNKIKINPELLILALSSILISFKSFWSLVFSSYGMFFGGFFIITFLGIVKKSIDEKKLSYTGISIFILLIAFNLGIENFSKMKTREYPINSNFGTIYVEKILYSPTVELINFIKEKVKNTDEIVILPEGLVINFLTGRKSDDFYNSLIPLYWEVFGDEKLIQHFDKTKPEYIVFSNWENKDYYLKYICSDYAVSFCNFVAKNYHLNKTIEGDFRYLIYKKK